MTNGQIVSISELGQIINNINNYTQYEHPFNPQPIRYVKKEQIGDMMGQQQDVVIVDSGKLKDFELDIKVRETQEMDKILAKFIILDNIPDVVFVTAEEFNTILNFYFSVFELWLFCDGNGPVQATVEEVILSVEHADFADVFSPTLAHELPPHAPHNHAIEINNDQFLFGPIYSLSAVELDVLKKYIKDNLEKGFIVLFMSSAGTLILFTKKKDGGLWLCMNYQSLNALTCKNKHPLLFINKVLDWLVKAKIYTRLDFKNAYNLIYI